MTGTFGQATRFSKAGPWWMRHSLSLVLFALLLIQSVVFHLLEWPDWVSDQQAHGQAIEQGAYWLHYMSEWFASVLADTYGALIIVLFTKWFYEQGSAESNG